MTNFAVPKSISNEETLVSPISELEVVLNYIRDLTTQTVERLVNEEMVTRTISIKLRYQNFRTITRSKTILQPTDDFLEIYGIAEELIQVNYFGEPLRLVGIGLSQLIFKKDLKDDINLFNYSEMTLRDRKITNTPMNETNIDKDN